MADADGESVCGVVRGGRNVETEDRLHHPLHLGLLCPAVAAHRLFDAGRRVLSALDSCERGRHEDGAPGLADRERGTGVDADEGLLERDGIWQLRSMRVVTASKIVFRRASGRSEAPVFHHP